MQYGVRAITTVIVLSYLCLVAMAKGRANVPPAGLWRQMMGKQACQQPCQDQLLQHLKRLTGWQSWQFTEAGQLVVTDPAKFEGGSAAARQLFQTVWQKPDVYWIEDHSGSDAVNFGQINEGLMYWDDTTGRHCNVWCVRLDFKDFREFEGSRTVRESFDAGFTFLHELLHGLGYNDAHSFESVGECEEVVNDVRRELGVAVRARYFAEALMPMRNVWTARLMFQRITPEGKPRKEWLYFKPGSETIVTNLSGSGAAGAVAARRR